MRDIAIFGAGGFGREVACLIKKINERAFTWNLIGFYDDNIDLKGKMISHYGTCLGGMEELNSYGKELDVIIAIGSPTTMKVISRKITNPNIHFPNIIHPDTVMTDPETVYIGKGNIIQAHCTFSCDVTIGDYNVLNGGVVFGHDVIVGSYNTFMPAVRVSGEVKVGNENFFGVGSIVLQQLKIGENVRLSAGSVLMTKPKDGQLYIGNPAKVFKY
jgi:sugar O-acyltransferase (sialic acid O-acetyltransferase NeuD family)